MSHHTLVRLLWFQHATLLSHTTAWPHSISQNQISSHDQPTRPDCPQTQLRRPCTKHTNTKLVFASPTETPNGRSRRPATAVFKLRGGGEGARVCCRGGRGRLSGPHAHHAPGEARKVPLISGGSKAQKDVPLGRSAGASPDLSARPEPALRRSRGRVRREIVEANSCVAAAWATRCLKEASAGLPGC